MPLQFAAPPAADPDAVARSLPAPPFLSVVVPVRNEAANIAPLIAEITTALAGVAHEIIYVDDGSTDGSWAELTALAAALPVRRLRHRRGCGQSAAIVTGVRAARGAWIATLDGDGQNDPADLPALLERALAEAAAGGAVMVVGHRVRRRDGAVKRVTSRIANAVRAWALRDATPDTGCGLKLFPRALFLELPAFDHMHRFLPALALRAGARVVSVPVRHRPRQSGRSKYGTLDRLAVSVIDLVGVAWLQRRWRRPEVVEEPGPATPVGGPGPAAPFGVPSPATPVAVSGPAPPVGGLEPAPPVGVPGPATPVGVPGPATPVGDP